MIITPTIGRKVWFRLNGTYPNSERAIRAVDSKQPMDATIVYVHDDRMVNLRVTDHQGNSHFFPVVTLRQEGDHISSGMYCEWMPFQVGQATKEAAQPTPIASIFPPMFAEEFLYPPQGELPHKFWPSDQITYGTK